MSRKHKSSEEGSVEVVEEETSKSVRKMADAFTKAFGEGSVVTLGGKKGFAKADQIIPLPILEPSLGIPGLPVGHVISIYGPEGVGKSTIMLMIIAAVQAMDGVVLMMDTEHSLDPTRARMFGVRLADVMMSYPETVEEAMKYVLHAAQENRRKKQVVCIIWDSVAATMTEAEMEADVGKELMASQARALSKGMKKIVHKLAKSNICFVAVNQIRESLNVRFGPKTREPGGRALKHAAAIRLEMKYGGFIHERKRNKKTKKKEKQIVGATPRITAVKNKMAPPFRTQQFSLYYDERGIQPYEASSEEESSEEK